jgi:hypothetical protein
MTFDETIKINFEDVNQNILIRFQILDNVIYYTIVKESNLEDELKGTISDMYNFEQIESNSEKIMYLLNRLKKDKII